MRDLGRMGESVFSQWCAAAGLTANNSNVDRTGWDFFVEFEFQPTGSLEFSKVHNAAFECKVQVKSTDNNDRKLKIKLSNLKRLATAPLPAFFVFIEFDGKDLPQRAFLVHVDHLLTSRILSRLHDVEQKGEDENLHKKTMTISYNEDHLLKDLSGPCLAEAMREHMGPDMSTYIEKKNSYLKTIGFDKGFAELTISTIGAEKISKLIDMSIGIETHAEISDLTAFKTRFGKKSSQPFLQEKNVKIEMPDLRPAFEGTIRLKADKIGSSVSFPAKLYISPFNLSVPEELRKCRIATDFFDLILNPFTNACTFSASFSDEKFEIQGLRNRLKFLQTAATTGQTIHSEFAAEGLPSIPLQMRSPGMPYEVSQELAAIEAGIKVISNLGIFNPVNISIKQLTIYASRILEMDQTLSAESKSIRIDIPSDEVSLSTNSNLVCLSFFSTPIGDIWVGTFVTFIGRPIVTKEGVYSILSPTKNIERIVVRERSEKILGKDLIDATELIEKKYEDQYQVVTLFDKNDFG